MRADDLELLNDASVREYPARREKRWKMNVAYEIKKNIGVISEGKAGWKKELNIVKWSGSEKYDIRSWDEDHEKCSKGITLDQDELEALYGILKGIFG